MTALQLGRLLNSARKAKGLSQNDLAAKVGVGQSRVSHLEQHAEEMSVAQLMAWCAALGLEVSIGHRGAPAASSSTSVW
ncbi:helix-turn-helix domain-containing protein [Roseateles sp. DC23W]|uniref:Helix-turn-helix domain-containing protein n=1 Tax=Pelomonas dachongensis TaxID=3299029 RepID=A0ABW7ERX2_9BURK